MANNYSPAQQALNAMLQRNFQQLSPQQNATGVNSTSPFMNEFASGFNLGNSIVNAMRVKRDNDRLAKQQADMDNPKNYLPDDYANYLQWKGQQALAQQQQVAPQQSSLISQQNPQQNVYQMGKPVFSVGEMPQQQGFGSVLNQDNPYPFGVSVNDKGQHITENGNASPMQASQPITVQQNQPQQMAQPFQQQLPQQRPYVANNGYTMQGFMQNAMNNGVSPLIGSLMYRGIVEPMEEDARQQRMRDSVYTMETAEENSPEWIKARNQLAVDLIRPDFGFDLQQKRRKADLEERQFMASQGYQLNPEYDQNVSDSIGNSIVSTALNNYKEGEQWMSPDGTGDSRTQCSNWVSDVLAKSGVKGLGSANGDELMKQAGKAYRSGLSGIQPGDVLNFKDHVGFYIGNGQYMARNSSGGVHRGSMEEAVKYFGQPLGYISMSQYTGNTRGQKYIPNPNFVSEREKFNYRQRQDAMSRALAEERLRLQGERIASRNGRSSLGNLFDSKGKFIAPYEIDKVIENSFVEMEENLIQQESDGVEKIKPSGKISMNMVATLNPVYKKLVDDGLSESQARATLKAYLQSKYKDLDKDAKGKIKLTHINDIIDQLSNNVNNDAQSDENLEVLNTSTPEVDAEQEMRKKVIATAQNQVYNQAFERARSGGVNGIGTFKRNSILPESYDSREEGEKAKANFEAAKKYAEAERDKIKTYEEARAYLDKNNKQVDMNKILNKNGYFDEVFGNSD